MAVTKTNFIEMTRCPKYPFLDDIRKDALASDMTYEEYKKEELNSNLEEIYNGMLSSSDDGITDNTEVVDIQLEAMLPYYKQVEIEAARIVEKQFGGVVRFAESTFKQEMFDVNINGIKYLCYVDIFNEVDGKKNLIEVKATTSNSYAKLGYTKDKIFYPVFTKIGNVYRLIDEVGEDIVDPEKYQNARNKLFDRFGQGKYVFDLAFQRYIIEHEYKESNNEDALKDFHYYLAVLNHEYTFPGKYDAGKAIYETDGFGEEIVTFIDLDQVTKEFQPVIDKLRKDLEINILNEKLPSCPLGEYCCYKKRNMCRYFKTVCGKMIPEHHSSLTFMRNRGINTPDGKLVGVELINHGYLNMLDIPKEYITNQNHLIQYECLEHNDKYIDKEKIKAGIASIKYPIYHLDFETFPCPLPRYRGEKPYTQSVFEFSLHTESEPGKCDKDKDNYVFLARDYEDCREECIKELLRLTEKPGTLLAQNVSFERSRIKELAAIFPEYRERLLKLVSNYFDLIWLVNTNKELYEGLGFDKEDASRVNYYDINLDGSYSIKKTLPVFSDLSYKTLDVKNGTEAIVTYANYDKMTEQERNLKYQSLITYCKQDTWAMVVILDALRHL